MTFITYLVQDDNLFRPDDGAQPVRHDQACTFFARAFYRPLDMSENISSSENISQNKSPLDMSENKSSSEDTSENKCPLDMFENKSSSETK